MKSGFAENKASRYKTLYNTTATLEKKIEYLGERTNTEVALVHYFPEPEHSLGFKSRAHFSRDNTLIEKLYKENILGTDSIKDPTAFLHVEEKKKALVEEVMEYGQSQDAIDEYKEALKGTQKKRITRASIYNSGEGMSRPSLPGGANLPSTNPHELSPGFSHLIVDGKRISDDRETIKMAHVTNLNDFIGAMSRLLPLGCCMLPLRDERGVFFSLFEQKGSSEARFPELQDSAKFEVDIEMKRKVVLFVDDPSRPNTWTIITDNGQKKEDDKLFVNLHLLTDQVAGAWILRLMTPFFNLNARNEGALSMRQLYGPILDMATGEEVPDEYPHIEPFRRQIASEFILLQESPSLVPSANSAMAMALSGVGADDALPDGDGGAGKADGDVAASDDEDGSRKAAALNKIKHESKAAPVGPVTLCLMRREDYQGSEFADFDEMDDKKVCQELVLKVLADENEKKQRFSKRKRRTAVGREFLTCEICRKVLSSETSLIKHMRICYMAKERTAQCSECGKVFKGRRRGEHLKKHIKLQHPEGGVKSVWDRKIHACEICGRKFVDAQYVKKHKMAYHPPQGTKTLHQVKCDECDAVYTSKASLNQAKSILNAHKRQKHNPSNQKTSYPCQVCGKVYHSKAILRSHFRKKHDEAFQAQSMTCPYCEKKFNKYQKHELECHMNMHKGIKTYICPICGKAFRNRSNLNEHRKYAHEGYVRVGSKMVKRDDKKMTTAKDHLVHHSQHKPPSQLSPGSDSASLQHLLPSEHRSGVSVAQAPPHSHASAAQAHSEHLQNAYRPILNPALHGPQGNPFTSPFHSAPFPYTQP